MSIDNIYTKEQVTHIFTKALDPKLFQCLGLKIDGWLSLFMRESEDTCVSGYLEKIEQKRVKEYLYLVSL